MTSFISLISHARNRRPDYLSDTLTMASDTMSPARPHRSLHMGCGKTASDTASHGSTTAPDMHAQDTNWMHCTSSRATPYAIRPVGTLMPHIGMDPVRIGMRPLLGPCATCPMSVGRPVHVHVGWSMWDVPGLNKELLECLDHRWGGLYAEGLCRSGIHH